MRGSIPSSASLPWAQAFARAGRAMVGPADQPVELGPGDYVSYPGDAPHIFSALEPDTTAVMLIESL